LFPDGAIFAVLLGASAIFYLKLIKPSQANLHISVTLNYTLKFWKLNIQELLARVKDAHVLA
jgi:hypothetical protein